jgi:uncharacterized protein (TIGR04255 family)
MADELPNKPLVEAILEFKWVPSGFGIRPGQQIVPWRDPYYPLLVGLLYESLKKRFPYVEELPAQQIPDELAAGIPKNRFRSAKDGYPLIQTGPGLFSVNFTESYKWETFQATAKDVYRQLVSSYRAAGAKGLPPLSSALLRYINAVAVPTEEHQTFIRDFLHVDVSLPNSVLNAKQVKGTPKNIDIRVEWPLSSPPGTGSLRIASGTRAGSPAIIFDLSASSQGQDAPVGSRVAGAWLTQAHNLLVETWFLSLIAGKLEERFRST